MEDADVPPHSIEANQIRMSEHVVVGWRISLYNIQFVVPTEFVFRVGDFLFEQDAEGEAVFKASYLELLVALLLGGVDFPVPSPDTGTWVPASALIFKEAPQTAATQLRVLKIVLKHLTGVFTLKTFWFSSLNLTELGVLIPQDGILMGFSFEALSAARAAIQEFTACRPVRASLDLARPFSFH